jgi:ABC-type enterochelin transport system substrate-binding protein
VKNTIFLVVLVMWLVACASNQSTQSADGKTADSGMPAGKKKVCKHERNTGGISRIKRVCRYVDDVEAI